MLPAPNPVPATIPGSTGQPVDPAPPAELEQSTTDPEPLIPGSDIDGDGDSDVTPPVYVVEYYYTGAGTVHEANIFTSAMESGSKFFYETGNAMEEAYGDKTGPATLVALDGPRRAVQNMPFLNPALTAINPLATAAFLPVVTSAVPAVGLATSVATVTDFWLIISREASRMLSVVGIKRRRKDYWGTVYDTQSKQPLDPVVVELIDAATGKVIAQSITDLWGKFGFLVRQGRFTLRAKKSHYVYPSTTAAGKQYDEIYDNLYFGEVIEISEDSGLLTPNIPMDPIAYDFNQEAKKKIIRFHPRLQWWSYLLLETLFYGGMAWSAFVFLTAPNWTNGIIFAVYGMVVAKHALTGRTRLWGKIIDSSRRPLAGMQVVLSPAGFANLVAAKTVAAMDDGRFFMKIAPGAYDLRILSGGQPIHASQVKIGPDGVLNRDIKI